jgi:hypothetical protein
MQDDIHIGRLTHHREEIAEIGVSEINRDRRLCQQGYQDQTQDREQPNRPQSNQVAVLVNSQ